jgi:hypothetical protein
VINVTGEFWATTDQRAADWWARSSPNSPPAARFEFDLPVQVLQALLAATPAAVLNHRPYDYEFLPASFAQLNRHMHNQHVVRIS